jgi:hypothetical protein
VAVGRQFWISWFSLSEARVMKPWPLESGQQIFARTQDQAWTSGWF